MKRKFTLLAAALMLLTMIHLPGNAVGQKSDSYYTITFGTGSGDGTSASTSTACSTIVSDGSDYLSGNLAVATKVYYNGSNGLKLGASSNAGELKMNLSTTGQVTPTSIVVNAKLYNSTKSATLSVNGKTAQSVTADFSDLTFDITSAITYLQLNSSKYIWINSITVNYGTSGGSDPSMSVSPSSIDFGSNTINPSEPYTETFNVTFANLTENLTVTGFTGVTVSPTTINYDATSPQTVTVSYNPTAEGSISGNITVSNTDDNLSETVAVTGSAYDPANVHYYEKVTEASSNWSGEYIFTGINSSNYYAFTGISYSVGTAALVTVTENGIQSTSTTDGYKVTVAQTTNGYSLYLAGAGYLYYTGSSNLIYAASTFTESTCEWTFSFANGVATITNVGNSSRILQFNYNSGNPRFVCYGNSGQTKITLFKYNDPNKVKTPTISPEGGECVAAQSVTISSETSGASIYYTTDGSTPTTSSTLFTTAFTVSTTTTVKAIAVKSGMTDSDVASVTYTFVTPFTTMQQVYEDAVANTSEHEVYITFNNWLITGTNGSSASQFYLTDPDNTYGCVIYGSGSGFTTGNTLNGTVRCKLLYFSGSSYSFAEIKELTTETAGLTVGTGGSVTPITTTIDALTSAKAGTVVKLENLTWNGTVLTDNNNNIINNSNYIYSATLTANKTYDVTGVFAFAYAQNETPKRICPRSASDIVLKAVLDIDASMTLFSYIAGNGPSAAQNIDVICTDLGSNTLTATASSDYEVSLTLDGDYTQSVEMSGEVAETVYVRLKAGLSVGEHNGTVTFTAANLTTQNVALEGLVSGSQTYSISLTQPAEATIAADKAIAEAGETVTLSYSDVVDCYEFTSWTVWKDDLTTQVSVENNQFTMPNCEVLVEATFTKKTFTVQYSVNGELKAVLNQTGINCGSEVTLKTAAEVTAAGVAMPTNYIFSGWSTSETSTAIVSSITVEDNTTLYAVMVPEGGTTEYVKVTSNLTDWTGEYLIVYETGNVAFNGGLATLDGAGNYISVTISDGVIASNSTTDAATFTFASTEGGYTIQSKSGKYIGRTANSNGLNESGTDKYVNVIAYSSNTATITSSSGPKLQFFATSGSERFRYYSSSQKAVSLYKKSTPAGCTRVYTKEISKYTADGNGWHLIASPVATTPTEVNNMLSNTYDLYRFNQAPTMNAQGKYLEWENYKTHQSGFDIVPGQGYLYANSNDVTLTFAGVPYNGDGIIPLTYSTENTDENMHGWNLIGNPFGSTATLPSALSYYTLNETRTELTPGSATTIEAMEAIFVQATTTGQSVTFTKQNRNAGSNTILSLNLSSVNNGVIDRAIVRFDEGNALPKFMLNPNNTKVFIPVEGKDYAVVRSEAQGEMPVSFRANENGQYTLTVNAEGVEMNYLHLIDNMTGADIDLLATPSYTFNAKTTDYESRFRLVFAANNEDGSSTSSETFSFYSNGSWVISNEGEATLQVIDALGRILSSEGISGTVSKSIDAPAGVYVLRLINGDNVKTQKIVVR